MYINNKYKYLTNDSLGVIINGLKEQSNIG